jgi:hypothetical protein
MTELDYPARWENSSFEINTCVVFSMRLQNWNLTHVHASGTPFACLGEVQTIQTPPDR